MMNVLVLGPEHTSITNCIQDHGDKVIQFDGPLSEYGFELDIGFIVSYGYRHIIRPHVIEMYPKRIINLHIAYLPWNRGADPNLWSYLDDTRKGITIHYIDAGIDTGDIIAQREIVIDSNNTLRTSYNILTSRIEELFIQCWEDIKAGFAEAIPQPRGGSYHKKSDIDAVKHLITNGWDTPVKNIKLGGR